MDTKREVLKNLFEQYVKGTQNGAVVVDKTVFFCHLTNQVKKVLGIKESTVYARTIPISR